MDRRTFCSRSVAALSAGLFYPWPRSSAQPPGAPRLDSASDAAETLAGTRSGPWRRLFLDGAVVEQQAGLSRVFHKAEKHHANPVVRRDQPWEGVSAITGPYIYGTVLCEDGTWRMWYQLLNKGNHVGYAESPDGVRWEKPSLGLIEYEGSRANNLVVSAFEPARTGGGHCHNPSVLRVPRPTDAQRRYALYGFDPSRGHARVAYSPDGLRWRFDEASAEQALFTSSDVVNFDYDPYRDQYYATWKTRDRRGRAVGIVWSPDGRQWTKPFEGPIFVADDLDPDDTQIYGMPAFPYQGMYVGLPWIYRARYFRYGEYSVNRLHEAQADSSRAMEVQLAWSWDLVNWTRPADRYELIPRGEPGAWDAGMIVTARAPVPSGDRLHFYYGGCDRAHDEPRLKAAIGLATLRLDGFCSLHAGDAEGWLISRREPFREPRVTINARCAAGGRVVAEILDRQNRVVPGFSRDDCQPFTGDSVRHGLAWKQPKFPADRQDADYKIRFVLQRADLYSYLPAGLDPEQRDLARF
ncbi:MAG: hypothetical protein AB7F89_13665 [Pirellulaceae bacterium]